MTVFSAPDYPQFQPNDNDRFNNMGAVAVLRSSQGNYTQPELVEYSAVPRPPVSVCQLQIAPTLTAQISAFLGSFANPEPDLLHRLYTQSLLKNDQHAAQALQNQHGCVFGGNKGIASSHC